MGLNEIIQGKHIDENCCTRVATQDGLPLCIRGKKRKPCQGEMREISGGKKKKKKQEEKQFLRVTRKNV